MGDSEEKLVLGLDLGTTNYKAGLYDAEGTLLGLGSTSPQYDTDTSGRVELPVEQAIELVQGAFAGAAKGAGVSLAEVAGVAYSTQANTFLLLDNKCEPLTPFVVWTDHRAKDFPSEYQALAKQPEYLHRIGFCDIAPGMMVANIGWFKQHQPEVWEAARYIMTLPDFLVHLMCGKRVSDSGVGALLGLWDIPNNTWWKEAVDAAGIPVEMLPELVYPGTVIGKTTADGGAMFGLPAGIPIVAGSLDHHVAAVGAGAGKKAPFSVSTGTVLAATCLDTKYDTEAGCCVGPGMNGDGYYRLAWHNNGTRALNWYRDTFAPGTSIDELLVLAAGVEPSAELPEVKLCPWEFDKDEVFSDRHELENHGIYVLAILNTMSDMLKDMLMRLQPDLVSKGIVVTGGGARCDLWMQMIAEKLQAPVYRSASEQAGCLGAAVLAATGAGWYDSIEEASAAMVKISDCIQPATAG